jgi:hypothetical protein
MLPPTPFKARSAPLPFVAARTTASRSPRSDCAVAWTPIDCDAQSSFASLRSPSPDLSSSVSIRIHPWLCFAPPAGPHESRTFSSALNNFDPPQLHFFTFTKQPG